MIVLATGGLDSSILYWQATTGSCHKTVPFNKNGTVNRLKASRDKSILVAAGNPNIKVFDLASPKTNPIHSLTGHQGNVLDIGILPEDGPPNKVYSCGEDRTIRTWDIRQAGTREVHKFTMRHSVNAVAYIPSYHCLVAGSDSGMLKVFSLDTGTVVCELLPEANNPVRSIAVSQERKLMVAACESGVAYCWGLGNGPSQQYDPLQKLQAHDAAVLRCSLSLDGSWLATASADTTIKVWDTQSFEIVSELRGHTRWVWDCVFSVDAAYVVSASSDCTACLWEVQDAQLLKTYRGHRAGLLTCALNDRQEV